MANERLRAVLLERGASVADLAAAVGVDPKTVERWITRGRTPYRKHRYALFEQDQRVRINLADMPELATIRLAVPGSDDGEWTLILVDDQDVLYPPCGLLTTKGSDLAAR